MAALALRILAAALLERIDLGAARLLYDFGRNLGALDARRAPAWDARVRAAMAGDFSWDRSVEAYLEVYRAAARP